MQVSFASSLRTNTSFHFLFIEIPNEPKPVREGNLILSLIVTCINLLNCSTSFNMLQ